MRLPPNKENFFIRHALNGTAVFWCSKPVSRVLSFKTAIYLDAPLLARSSRLLNTTGPVYVCAHGVAPDRVYSDGRFHTPSGELLPRLSTLTAPPKRSSTVASGADPLCVAPSKEGVRRYISVALVLGSPPAGVTRYPCPAEPGLSSQAGLSPRPRGCPAYCGNHHTGKKHRCQMPGKIFFFGLSIIRECARISY